MDAAERRIKMAGYKTEYILEGLDCANCAAKIERKVNEIEGVETATLNFVTKTLAFSIGDRRDLEALSSQVKSIIKSIEPDVTVRESKKDINTEKEGNEGNKKELTRLIIGTVIFAVAVFIKFSTAVEFTLYFISYALVGAEVLIKAVRNIFRGQVFDENFLMSIATIGAFAIKQFPEGVAVMLFYQIGEFIQDIAVNRSEGQ